MTQEVQEADTTESKKPFFILYLNGDEYSEELRRLDTDEIYELALNGLSKVSYE